MSHKSGAGQRRKLQPKLDSDDEGKGKKAKGKKGKKKGKNPWDSDEDSVEEDISDGEFKASFDEDSPVQRSRGPRRSAGWSIVFMLFYGYEIWAYGTHA